MAGEISVINKDIDFGEPARIKRFYGARITYKSSAVQTNAVQYILDNATTATKSFSGGNFSATTDWQRLSPSITPKNCQSVRLLFSNPTNNGTINIGDIALDYRIINKRVT